MSVMTGQVQEDLHRTLLFLRRTLPNVRRLFEALIKQSGHDFSRKHLCDGFCMDIM